MNTPYTFTLTLDTDDHLSSSKVRNTHQDVEDLLKRLTRTVSGQESTWQWADDATIQMTLSPNGVSQEQVAKTIDLAYQGFAAATNMKDSQETQWPDGFDDDARQQVKKVLHRLKDVERIRVSATNHDELVITEVNIGQRIRAKKVTRVFSSVEGVLEGIFSTGGYRFNLRENGTGLLVKCWFSRGHRKEVLGLFERHVVVEGMVAYNSEGQPTSIRDIERITPREVTRKLSEFRGTVPDILGDHDIDDHTERMRG